MSHNAAEAGAIRQRAPEVLTSADIPVKVQTTITRAPAAALADTRQQAPAILTSADIPVEVRTTIPSAADRAAATVPGQE